MSSTSTLQNRRATRSSLACLPCRSRHMKCDGKRPCCARCTNANKQCSYAASRRGGPDRAAQAERRKILAAAEDHPGPLSLNDSSTQQFTTIQQVNDCSSQSAEVDHSHDAGLPDTIITVGNTQNISLPAASVVDAGNIEDDALVDVYYKNFHRFHPFVLPQKHLTRIYRDPGRQLRFTPLVAVLRLIGNIYTSHEWSASSQDYIETCFAEASPSDPIMVQCRLLYSMALFWYDYRVDAKKEMDNATMLAINLQMFEREFAGSHGAGDPVLRESWRRTWWMLSIVDVYYAGTLGTKNFALAEIAASVELPCEESEYESGNIPEPKTVEDFNCREFAPEGTRFSSFAYLIGAVQCAVSAISAASKIVVKEHSTHVIQTIDCSLDAWRLLLPRDGKQVMAHTGEIDELMFQAHLLVHVATIGVHRPFSTLKFNATEDLSSCARERPLEIPAPDLVNVHTIRVLRSVEVQIRLLALPVQEFRHTPFTTCMVSEGTLALLSACVFLLREKDLVTARDQIRMTIGCLKALGEVWPRAARNVRELQTIGQNVLGLQPKASNHASDAPNPVEGSHSFSAGEARLGSNADASSNDTSIASALNSMPDLCGWYNLGDQNEFLWGMGDGS